MMDRRLLYILPVFALAYSSCKKNELPAKDDSGEPVFYVKASVNGTPLEIRAGVNDYYMNSSYFLDSNNVYVYKGDLRQSGGAALGYGISFLINDYKPSAQNEPMNPDSGLFVGHYQFNDGNLPPLGYNAVFLASYIPTVGGYTWTYAGAKTFNQTFNAYFPDKTSQLVNLKVGNGSFCETEMPNTYKVGNPLQANIFISKQGNSYTFSVATTIINNTSYFWNFGNGDTLTTTANIIEFDYGTIPISTIASCRIVNGMDTCIANAYVNTNTQDCHANFTHTFTPVPNAKKLSTISIQLTDPSGKVYSSGTMDQPSGSSFQILSVENYMSNLNGDPTKKVKIRFNASVKNGNETISITNGEAVIAVAYKP